MLSSARHFDGFSFFVHVQSNLRFNLASFYPLGYTEVMSDYPRVSIKDVKVYLTSLESAIDVSSSLTKEITIELHKNSDDKFLRIAGLLLTNQLLLMAGVSALLQNMINVKEDLGDTDDNSLQ